MRLVSKSDSTVWKCKVCLCKVVQLNKVMGAWPTEEFKGLTEEEQKSFMRDIGKLKTGEEVEKYASHALGKYQQQAEYLNNSGAFLLDNSGEFLPLSVWAAKLFDTDAVTRKARHGMTYRILWAPTPVSTPRLNTAEEQKVATEAEPKSKREAKEEAKAAREAEKKRKREAKEEQKVARKAAKKRKLEAQLKKVVRAMVALEG